MRINKRLPYALIALLVSIVHAAAAAPVITPAPPDVAANAYIMIDFNSGRVLAQKQPDERMEPASLTKMMTSHVVFNELKSGHIKLEDDVLISEKAWRAPGSRSFVEVGTRVSVEDLLRGVIIQSGNDATIALAEHVAGSEDVFVTLMNQQAEQLGLANTHFVNSTGLPHPDHYTAARDMAQLARAVIHAFPEFYQWYAIKEFTYNNITQYNRNKLLWRDRSVDGIKTGHTESAGYCLVASGIREGMRLISVVLGTKSENARARESQKLLSYGFRFFETHHLYNAGQKITDIRIWKGEQEMLPLGLSEDLFVTIPRGSYEQLDADTDIGVVVRAPASKHQRFGAVNVRLNGADFVSRPLVALQDIPEGGLFQRLKDEVLLWFE